MSSMRLDLIEGAGSFAGADFSPCRTWRYKLWRTWDARKGFTMFLMLNPSTADEAKNDPTVERCQRYAIRWGYGGLIVCNLFAYRATAPAAMKAAGDPVGPGNDAAILECAARSAIIVCAWGNHGSHLGRSGHVKAMLSEAGHALHCLTVTGRGEPGHPLYLRKDLMPILMDT